MVCSMYYRVWVKGSTCDEMIPIVDWMLVGLGFFPFLVRTVVIVTESICMKRTKQVDSKRLKHVEVGKVKRKMLPNVTCFCVILVVVILCSF